MKRRDRAPDPPLLLPIWPKPGLSKKRRVAEDRKRRARRKQARQSRKQIRKRKTHRRRVRRR